MRSAAPSTRTRSRALSSLPSLPSLASRTRVGASVASSPRVRASAVSLSSCTRLLAPLALLLALACAHAPPAAPPAPPDAEARAQDVVWRELEEAFALLRRPNEPGAVAGARKKLEAALASFEDLAAPSNLEAAFAKDRDMPYRGRPHERVLAALTLALLDMSEGRCDLALPTLRTAALLDARWQAPDPERGVAATDVALVPALELRCLDEIGAAAPDRDRARRELVDSLRVRLPDDVAEAEARALEAAARAERLAIWLHGTGPTVALEGRHREVAVVQPGHADTEADTEAPTRARCGLAAAPDGGLLIGLCRGEGEPAVTRDRPFPVASARPVWSSTEQATTVHERRFTRVLKGRAVFKDTAGSASSTLSSLGGTEVQRSLSSLARCPRGAKGDACVKKATPQLVVGGVLLASAAGLFGAAVLTQPSADDRYVSTLFEAGTLLVAPTEIAQAVRD